MIFPGSTVLFLVEYRDGFIIIFPGSTVLFLVEYRDGFIIIFLR